MNEAEIRGVIIAELANIAPEADAGAVDPRADFRDALDLDSMDMLNLVVALTRRLKVDIPEIDTPKLTTLAGATSHLAAKLGGATTAGPP